MKISRQFKRLTRILLILIALVINLIDARAEEQKEDLIVATVTKIEGTVTIKSRGSSDTIPARIGIPLYKGDKLITKSYAKADLCLKDDSMCRVMPNSIVRMEIKKNKPEIICERGKVSKIDITIEGIGEWVLSKFYRSIHNWYFATAGSSKGEDKLQMIFCLSPRKTRIMSPQPTFIFRYVEWVKSYSIELYSGTKTVWSEEVDSRKIVWDEEPTSKIKFGSVKCGLKLTRGKEYSWQILMKGTATTKSSKKVNFTVLDSRKVKEVKGLIKKLTQHNCSPFQLGVVYEKEGLFREAEKQYLKAIELEPENALGYMVIGDLYCKTEAYGLAKAIFLQAKRRF